MTESLAHLASQTQIHNILCLSGCLPDEHSLIYTLFHDPVALFTALLFISTVLLWWTTRRATKLAEEQHVRSNRAFAYLDHFDHFEVRDDSGTIQAVRVISVFRNSGNSPTRNALISIQTREQQGELPADFDYPITTAATIAFVGPGAEVAAPFFDIPWITIGRVRTKEANFYVWGSIAYRDIFKNTPPHSTEFCFRLNVITAPNGFYYGFSPYGSRNRADTDTRIVQNITDVFSSWLANVYDVMRKR